MSNFIAAAQAIASTISANRRALHRHPELGFQETWTTQYLTEQLTKSGLSIVPWGGETGVVALLQGGKPGPCVALRSDIDALPIQEQNSHDYCSQYPGYMHACGHDGHMAALLGAAHILAEAKDELAGSVKFIFQPAEEMLNGAATMVAKGVLRKPDVDVIFGMHNTPELPTGKFALQAGPLMAAVASTSLLVHGLGGHGAIPHKAKDPILAAAGILQALQSIISRQLDPQDAAVISFGSIHGGTLGNIIPETVELQGTVRFFNPELAAVMEEKMRTVISNAAAAYQTTADFRYSQNLPSVINPAELVEWMRPSAVRIFGEENLVTVPPSMGGEDFAHFQAEVPGVFCWFGSGNKARGIEASWHNPHFDLDESALVLAAAMFAQLAYDWNKDHA